MRRVAPEFHWGACRAARNPVGPPRLAAAPPLRPPPPPPVAARLTRSACRRGPARLQGGASVAFQWPRSRKGKTGVRIVSRRLLGFGSPGTQPRRARPACLRRARARVPAYVRFYSRGVTRVAAPSAAPPGAAPGGCVSRYRSHSASRGGQFVRLARARGLTMALEREQPKVSGFATGSQ